MKLYENADDQHVRKVVLYEVDAGLAFDEAGTELLTKEEIIDAFLKGCVVENADNYKIPTGCNVTDTKAELVFGGEGSGSGSSQADPIILYPDYNGKLYHTSTFIPGQGGGYGSYEFTDPVSNNELINLFKSNNFFISTDDESFMMRPVRMDTLNDDIAFVSCIEVREDSSSEDVNWVVDLRPFYPLEYDPNSYM